MEVISGEKIVKSYGKFKVLKGINLNVQDGEFRNYGKIRKWKDDTFENSGTH